MQENLTTFAREAAAWLSGYATVSTALQLLVIVAGVFVAWIAGTRLEKALERPAHGLKGNAQLLRLVIAVIRRSRWIVLIAWLFAARLVLFLLVLPYGLVTLALLLAGAWFVISVLTRLIRNRTLARLVAIAVWTYVALVVLGVEDTAALALDRLALDLGTVRVSALMVLRAVVLTGALVWLALFIGRLVEGQINRADDISASGRVLFAKVIQIALVVVAGTIALTATGIDLTALAVVWGAIGLGLGFGLQKVVSNFVSGIIILLDRSVKPGDTISLGDTFGWVTELRSRFVSVHTRDGRKYLIPNEDFITQQVINWSYRDSDIRLDVDFGVAYASDPHQVTALAIGACKTVGRVSTAREPVCWITEFGENSLNFKLRFWIIDPQAGLTNVRGQVLMALWDAFKAAGIAIPFPQRVVRFADPLEVKQSGERPG